MQEIWNKLVRFCNYQERCRNDVLKKLRALEVPPADFNRWIARLEQENLLNEQRFIKLFISGRFRNKKWGKRRIEMELKKRNISGESFIALMQELLPEEDYQTELETLAARKWKTIKGENIAVRKQKLFRFLLGKGFESSSISAVLKQIKA